MGTIIVTISTVEQTFPPKTQVGQIKVTLVYPTGVEAFRMTSGEPVQFDNLLPGSYYAKAVLTDAITGGPLSTEIVSDPVEVPEAPVVGRVPIELVLQAAG